MQTAIRSSDTKEPTFIFKNSHLMTVSAALLPRQLNQKHTEAAIIPVDNDSAILAQLHLHEDRDKCLVIVHGLEGSSNSAYVTGLTAAALAAGFNVARLNLRNCGNTLHLTPTLYNAGQSGDLLKTIDWLEKYREQKSFYITGYSLGGNLILKALAEASGDKRIKAACAVSPSIDLAASVDKLEQGFNRVYEKNFLFSLKNKIKAKHKLFPERYNLQNLKLVRNLRGFDNVFTAPTAGYTNGQDYYKQASARFMLDKIQNNTLIITAQDDPIVPFDPFRHIENKYIQLIAPKHGGHVSFLSSSGFGINMDLFWTDKQILSYFCQQ